MARPTFLKRIASLVAAALLFAQLAVAAHACPVNRAAAPMQAVAAAMPDCHEHSSATDASSPNLCAEHCKQGQQSERANFAVTVPPALLNPLYQMPAVPETVQHPQRACGWLSALVAASPPHAIAHCALRI